MSQDVLKALYIYNASLLILLGKWPVCLGNLVGRCKKTSLSRGRLVPAASPSVVEVALLKTTPSASPSNFESKMARAVVSIAASLFVAFYKTEWARGRQTALEKSTFQHLCLSMHLLKQHWSSFFRCSDLITVGSYHKFALMDNALSKPLPALVLEGHWAEAGAKLLSTPPFTPSSSTTTALLTGNSRARCLPVSHFPLQLEAPELQRRQRSALQPFELGCCHVGLISFSLIFQP